MMDLRGLSVGTRFDGSVDVDIQNNDESSWNTSNLTLAEAEFLYEELARAIVRQKERGYPRQELPPIALTAGPDIPAPPKA